MVLHSNPLMATFQLLNIAKTQLLSSELELDSASWDQDKSLGTKGPPHTFGLDLSI